MGDERIERVEGEGHGAFVIRNTSGQGPANLAELTYRSNEGVMTIVHTGVRDALRGRGIARRLLDAAIEFARARSLKVDPQCSYASKVFEENADTLGDLRVARPRPRTSPK